MKEAELAELLARNPALRLKAARTPQVQVESPVRRPHDNQRTLALAMSEDELQTSIIDLAHLYRWKVAHFRSVKIERKDGEVYWATPVAADGEGFPDLVLARDAVEGMGRILFVETKKEREKPRPTQVEWLQLLTLTKRVEVYVFRPTDWLSGKIDGILR